MAAWISPEWPWGPYRMASHDDLASIKAVSQILSEREGETVAWSCRTMCRTRGTAHARPEPNVHVVSEFMVICHLSMNQSDHVVIMSMIVDDGSVTAQSMCTLSQSRNESYYVYPSR